MAEKPKQYELHYLPLFWGDPNEAVSYNADVLQALGAAENLINKMEAGILTYLEHPPMAPIYKTTRDRPLPYSWFECGQLHGVLRGDG